MSVHAEITGAILRLRNRADALPTDPYDHVIYVVGDWDTAIFKGMRDDEFLPVFSDPENRRAIARVLVGLGFKRVGWVRMRHGEAHPTTFDLTEILERG